MTPEKWIDQINAAGIVSESGRYGGGTYANMESYNSILIGQGKQQSARLIALHDLAVRRCAYLSGIEHGKKGQNR